MTDTPQTPPAAPEAANNGAADARQVLLQKIFVKDASVEVPQAPAVFTRPWQPQVDVQVNSKVDDLGNDHWQVVLTVTVTAKLGEDTAFLVEAHQAGVFTIKGFQRDAELGAVLGAYCPGLIFPFARETIADLVQRAGFPQLLLQPINFDALYLEHQRRQQQAAQSPAPAAANATH